MFLDAMGCMLTRHPKRDGSLERGVTPVKMISLLGTSAYADGPLLPSGYFFFLARVHVGIKYPSMRWKPKARVVTRTAIFS